MTRKFIGDFIEIDGRMICYQLFTGHQYLMEKNGWTEEQVSEYIEENHKVYLLINQIMALKQSCFLLRRVSHSCGSLADHLYELKVRLIHELRDVHSVEFDDEFVENWSE